MSTSDAIPSKAGLKWLMGLFISLAVAALGTGAWLWSRQLAAVSWIDHPGSGFIADEWAGWPCDLERRRPPNQSEATWSKKIPGARPGRVMSTGAISINGETGERLRQVPEFSRLDLRAAPSLTSDFFEKLGRRSRLESMTALNSGYDDSCAAHLNLLPGLRTLALIKTKITGESLPALPELTRFYASGSNFTDAGCRRLLTSRKLTHVDLEGTAITLDGARDLLSLPDLKTLVLPQKLDKTEVRALMARAGRAVEVR